MKQTKNQKNFSAIPINKEPENVSELLNKYGTYEIQPTADTSNQYPAIAQGFSNKGKNSKGFPKT